jgi:putative aldouronate transport system permease protein
MKQVSLGYKIFQIMNHAFLVLMSITFLYPYLNVLAISLNDPDNTKLGGIFLIPRAPTLYNFEVLLNDSSLGHAAFITVARILIGTSLALLVQFGAGYAFTKKGFRGRSSLLVFLMIPMFIGGGLIPYYLMLASLNLMNTFWVYILPDAFVFFNMVIIRVYIQTTIPESLEEAARLDGANDFRILFRIVLPLCMPIIATIGLFTIVFHWNDWTTTLFFAPSKTLHTLQYRLMLVLKESEALKAMISDSVRHGNVVQLPKATPESIRSALIVATTLPIIAIYPFLQKYFLKGAVVGALKD